MIFITYAFHGFGLSKCFKLMADTNSSLDYYLNYIRAEMI